jgi:phospho-N-acetylmuramoyl-pentapeptide-transferase
VLSTLAYGLVGFADDYIKVVQKRSLGLTARRKLAWQLAIGLAVGSRSTRSRRPTPRSTRRACSSRSSSSWCPTSGLFYIAFAVWLLTLSSNAVNLTTGSTASRSARR